MNAQTLRNIANFAFDAADRAEARRALDSMQSVFERNRNEWKRAASEALRTGGEVWAIANRARVVPWDGRMTAYKV